MMSDYAWAVGGGLCGVVAGCVLLVRLWVFAKELIR